MNKISLFLIMLFPVVAMAQQLTLTGTIEGLPDNTSVLLINLEKGSSTIGETKSKGGMFTLSGQLDGPSILGLMVGDSSKTALFVGNDVVKVTGNMKQKMDDWKFTGSKTQDDFAEFQDLFIPKFERVNQIGIEQQSGAGSDVLDDSMKLVVADIQQNVDAFIAKHPASPVSAMVVLSTIGFTDDIALLEKRAGALSKEVMQTSVGSQLQKALEDARFNAVGTEAAGFTQKDTAGKEVSLDQFRGKYVLVDFWASWCGPCRRENPNVVHVYNKYRDKNFTVLGVSLDEEKEAWLKAIEKDGLTWTQVSDLKGWENEVAQQYRITAIPRNFLIGPDGKIIGKDLRGRELENKLAEILDKK
ncbi:alkyl hydroperoxide reductase [Niabella ginsenosidivorans]|uniref:Alkyl hydroperoxide reductase n=1 Tax=Niabella ginsenosidivorans TaxID=1176587 RepID=A0A1A9HZF3_9BACT|nr:TlpA disulfide reductase family protein [Niabella ginsenosidivorans]ANH79850.1 alkyl hydroperoxide reductase [Niabella ginsenosidivorans]